MVYRGYLTGHKYLHTDSLDFMRTFGRVVVFFGRSFTVVALPRRLR